MGTHPATGRAEPEGLARLRHFVDDRIREASDQTAQEAGNRILCAAGIELGEFDVTWLYEDGRLDGMARAGTSIEELQHLCASVAVTTRGDITITSQATIIECRGWLPFRADVDPDDRLRVRVWGTLPTGDEVDR
jgi:hypothetical protein